MSDENAGDRGIHALLEAQVERTPDGVAVVSAGDHLTYRELNVRANQWAHHLRSLGVGRDVLVGISAERSVELVIGVLAVLKAGGAYVPLDPDHPRDRLAYLLEDTAAPVVLTQGHLLSRLPASRAAVLCLDAGEELVGTSRPSNPENGTTGDDLAYVIHTSGSTGTPKGVMIPHRALCNHMLWMQDELPLTQADKVLQRTPFSFDASVWELFAPLLAGAQLVLARPGAHRDSAYLIEEIRARGITTLQVVPSMLRMLVETGGLEECRSLRRVFCGGEALPATLAGSFRARSEASLYNLYGPTEACIDATCHEYQGEITPGTVPIGRPISHVQVVLLDDERRPVPPGQPGEIYIGGRGVARGYLNRPDLTRQSFFPAIPGDPPGERLYRTGDLGRVRPDGDLEFLGRLDHQVKLRGFRIELGEIEAVLGQHPAVRQAAVLVTEESEIDRRLVAYITPRAAISSGAGVEEERVAQWGEIWDEAYRKPAEEWDRALHVGGWNDSYTGKALPEAHVKEWVDHTVQRILSLSPRRVLEIGCGTGMLLFRIAPGCSHYLGTDVSEEAVRYIGNELRGTGLESIVTLHQAPAHRLPDLPPGAFDTVVINSVIAMFPSMDYLVSVLTRLLELVAPGGVIFLGDVESWPLQEALHTSVHLHQATGDLPVPVLRERIRERIFHENKLLVAPAFFAALARSLPQIADVNVQLKRGRHQNELTRFRYDVTLRVGRRADATSAEPEVIDWQSDRSSLAAVRARLATARPEELRISGVPSARTWAWVQAVAMLADPGCPATVGELRARLGPAHEEGIEPEDFQELGHELACSVQISQSRAGGEGCYDVLFSRPPSGARTEIASSALLPAADEAVRPWAAYANNPMQSREALAPMLRSYLLQKLPEHMVPTHFVFLDELPLTPSGKVDRNALPAHRRGRPALAQPPVAPRTPAEAKLAEIWAQVLDVRPIGVHDSFFELGGHSLLILQLLDQVQNTFGVELPLRCLFTEPTVAGLARALETFREGEAATPLDRMTVRELLADANLDPAIRPTADRVHGAPESIFLTGATGFLGSFLLEQLLRQTRARIFCLVRGARGDAEALKRIRSGLERYQLAASLPGDVWRSRIVPVPGDLAAPLLGLDARRFEELGDQLDVIYHAGADVNILYPYSVVRAANVGGTHEVLRLAALRRLKPVHHISSTGVFESFGYSGKSRPIREHDSLLACEEVYGGYCQSKWVAEELVTAARSRGMPVSVYRPGLISAHSVTGACNTGDMLCRLLKCFIEQGKAPDLDIRVDMTPVDYMTDAILQLSRQETSLGGTFHIANPRSLRLSQLVDEVRSLGYTLQRVDPASWLAGLRQVTGSTETPLGGMLPLLTGPIPGSALGYLEMSSLGMPFDCEGTAAALRGTSVVCPPVDGRLLQTFFAYMIRSGFLPAPGPPGRSSGAALGGAPGVPAPPRPRRRHREKAG